MKTKLKKVVPSASCLVLSAKKMLAVALCAVGLSAFAEESVTINEVKSVQPWDKAKGTITVDYSLGGVDAATDYKVAFDITAGGQTASVTNDATKLTDGAATKEIDTAKLFGKEVVDTKAKVKVSIIAIKPKPLGVQLWKDGPIWAECNVGDGATVPGDYGDLYTFDDNKAADAAASLGADWRLPTKDELSALLSNCTTNWVTCKDSTGADRAGYRFTGKGDYSSNSIFLPAAGYARSSGRESAGDAGYYWTSKELRAGIAYRLNFHEGNASVDLVDSSFGQSVRAVRDAK